MSLLNLIICLVTKSDAALDHTLKLDGIPALPPHDFLSGDAPRCGGPAGTPVTSSAVMPSLPLTINWLRDCVRGNPSLKLEVSERCIRYLLERQE